MQSSNIRIVFALAAIACAPAAAADDAKSNTALIVKAQPVARFVLPSSSRVPFEEFMSRYADGYFLYNDEYRHPFKPEGPLKVDCTKANRIGVAYALAVPEFGRGKWQQPGSTFALHFTWEHASVKLHWPRARHRHVFWITGRPGWRIYHERMDLTKGRRVNGVYTVTAYFQDEKLFDSQLELVGCENYKTTWERWLDEGEERKAREQEEEPEPPEDPDELLFY